jgi:hypothetical protein
LIASPPSQRAQPPPTPADLALLVVLANRLRRERREAKVLCYAVIACNLAYMIAAVVRQPSLRAWLGVLVASVAAHGLAWRSRRYARVLERELRVRLRALQ